jgi:3-mercaptopyruvate sulfurtransferase SseA
MPLLPSLVAPDALEPMLSSSDLVVLDTTWSMTYEGPKSPLAGYESGRIPGARLFDHAQVRDDDSPLHDTLCSASQFDAHVRSLGVSQQHVVCYSQGLFSSAARANLPSSSVIEGGRIKPVTALAALVGEAGIDASRPTVTSCSLGVGASGSAFILHLLGNDGVAVFDGAREAWAAAARATR